MSKESIHYTNDRQDNDNIEKHQSSMLFHVKTPLIIEDIVEVNPNEVDKGNEFNRKPSNLLDKYLAEPVVDVISRKSIRREKIPLKSADFTHDKNFQATLKFRNGTFQLQAGIYLAALVSQLTM